MEDQPSRSPSPASAPPIAATPGPRATALQKLYADATAHILKTCNYANFSACFPTPARAVPESLKLLHQDFSSNFEQQLHMAFNELLEDREVVAKLNGLDNLIEDARRRKAAGQDQPMSVPPHTLPAQKLYAAHLAPSLSHYSADLTSRQEVLASENLDLLPRVMQQRRDIEALVKGLEERYAQLEACAVTFQAQSDDEEERREELRVADEEMRTGD